MLRLAQRGIPLAKRLVVGSRYQSLLQPTKKYINAPPTMFRRSAARLTTTTQLPQRTESAQLKSEIMQFLYKNKQQPVPTTEKNVILTNCPHCIKLRKNSFAAYLDTQKGTYRCTTCKSKGSFAEFSKTLLKKLEHPNDSNNFAVLSTGNLLSGNNAKVTLDRSQDELNSYIQNLTKDDSLLQKFEEEHCINKNTLEVYRVGLTEVNGSPCLAFPQTALSYRDDAFQTDTVRLKLCDANDPTHLIQMDPPTSGKESTSGLFGYQTASFTDDTVIITRRELDAMAAHQATGLPAVSLPSSNYQLQESVLPLLERFTNIYLWLDDDVDGKIAAERFARKIGEYKCLLVNTRQGDQQGPLNAHAALVENKDLKQILASAQGIKHDQIVDFHDLREEVYNEVLHPEQTKGVASKDLPGLNEIIKGHRPGELTILTGPTGAGKTTIISQLSLDYCKSGVPTLWGSFEILNKRLAKKMLYQYAGKDLSQHPEEFDQVADGFEQLPLYFLKFFSSTAIGDVLKACHHAVYAYDVRHIVLDNLQFMLSQQGASMDKWDIQDNAIAEIRRFATQQDVHVTLVVHPRKDSGVSEELDIHSIFGSAKVTQEADNVIIIQKPKWSARKLDIKKNRFDGTLGALPYTFDTETHKIREFTEEEKLEQKKKNYKKKNTVELISGRGPKLQNTLK